MSCAELLAVCLLSADRGPKPHRQPLPIFHDVNDGKLSFEEFKNYFADGILSSEELWELFSGIDRRHSDNVDTEKLCGKSGDIPARESFPFPGCVWWGRAGWTDKMPEKSSPLSLQRYESSSKMEQFLTRFLLRETMHQLQSLQASLECAVDTVEEQAGRERKEIKKSETSVSLRSGRRCGRRGQKNVCLTPTDPYSGMLTTGTAVPRVARALLEPGLFTNCECTQTVLWKPHGEADVQRDVPLAWAAGAHIHAVPGLCQGCASLPSPGSGSLCPHSVSACKLTDEACFILYEFWQDVTSWRSHLQSSCSKTFQQSILSLLESPELLTTMLFPASWWIMNNN
ncbi:NECA3 protein, partial [Grantiella picta]|nr:NECA3 protein [Grantiella picta]